MTMLDYMHSYLNDHIRESSQGEKQRNINLICHYYGFDESPLPTFQQVGDAFGLTKQRAGQIIQRDFRSRAKSSTWPMMKQLLKLIRSRPFWTASELDAASSQQGFSLASLSLPGLIRLIEDMGLANVHDSYTGQLKRVTSSGTYDSTEFFLVERDELDSLRTHMETARKLQGRRGIVRFEDLAEYADFFDRYKNFATQIIHGNPATWIRAWGGYTWYLFEENQNALINAARKALVAFPTCDAKRLAPSIRRTLKRINEELLPPVELVEDYLRTSRLFVANGNAIRLSQSFRPKAKSPALSPLEKGAVEYLRAHGETSFPVIRDSLRRKYVGKYSEAAVDKVLTNSPLVFVDESEGRTNYKYSTVELLDRENAEEARTLERYYAYRDRLDELRETDSTSEQSARREQYILSQWLFEDKVTEHCALCKGKFAIEALVTAHKKRREQCNEGERRDPYIVMPICVFGCDYLYEKQHIYIEGGVITRGIELQRDGIEKAHANRLVGTRLEDRWLEGPSSYFHQPTE